MNEDNQALAGRLHHVEMNVSDLAHAREFWGWLLMDLGYTAYQDWDGGFSYKLGPTYIVFVQTSERYLVPSYHRSRTGLNHLAFHARSKQHVDDLAAELLRRGYVVLYSDRHPHAGGPDHYAVFFEDPDQIKVELVAPHGSPGAP
jgi:catechol 2,3-dioxygenase-like lactoylglutathione lyase family enzyme